MHLLIHPWTAGAGVGLIRQVLVCSDPVEAEAYLSLHQAKYTNKNALYCCALGTSLPNTLNLPNAKITLLFENTPLGKIWDIKVACLIRHKPVSIKYHNGLFDCHCNNRHFNLGAEKVSLSAFEQAAGIRTNIRTAKAKGYTTFLEQLQNTNP